MAQSSAFRERFVIPWVTENASADLKVNQGVFTDSVGGIDLTLPLQSQVGDVIAVLDLDGGFTILQNANQQITTTGAETTLGVLGELKATAAGNAVVLVCVEANTTWAVESMNGELELL